MKNLVILVLAAALPAAAQWRRFGDPELRPIGYFGAGVSVPVNPLASRLDNGWNLAGGIGVGYRYIGITLDGMFSDFGLNRSALAQEDARGGYQKYWAFSANPIFHVNPRGPIDFYLTGGVGVYGEVVQYRSSSNYGRFPGRYDLVSTNHLVKPGANLGAGFAFHLGRERDPKVFVEARYHHMFTRGSGASLIPVTVGVRF